MNKAAFEIVLKILAILVMIIGACGNGFSLYIFISLKNLKVLERQLLLALTICDLINVVIFPLEQFIELQFGFPYNNFSCVLFDLVYHFFLDMSLLIVILMLFLKLLSVKNPIYKSFLKLKMKIGILAASVIYLIVKATLSSVVKTVDSPILGVICKQRSKILESVKEYHEFIYLCLIIFANIFGLLALRQAMIISKKKACDSFSYLENITTPRRQNETEMIVGLSLMSISFSIPIIIFSMVKLLFTLDDIEQSLWNSFFTFVILLNNMSHFVCCLLTSSTYRHKIKISFPKLFKYFGATQKSSTNVQEAIGSFEKPLADDDVKTKSNSDNNEGMEECGGCDF